MLGSLSSQKRPVGLDHDEVDGVADDYFFVGGVVTPGGGGVLKEATNSRSSLYSNCNFYEQKKG